MFNFREGFEQIKRAITDYPQFVAEMFLEESLNRVRCCVLDFKDIKTLNFTYHRNGDHYSLATLINNNGCCRAKGFDTYEEGKEIFEKLKSIVKENYSDVVIEEDSFYVKF